jgi:hypothetical protein
MKNTPREHIKIAEYGNYCLYLENIGISPFEDVKEELREPGKIRVTTACEHDGISLPYIPKYPQPESDGIRKDLFTPNPVTPKDSLKNILYQTLNWFRRTAQGDLIREERIKQIEKYLSSGGRELSIFLLEEDYKLWERLSLGNNCERETINIDYIMDNWNVTNQYFRWSIYGLPKKLLKPLIEEYKNYLGFMNGLNIPWEDRRLIVEKSIKMFRNGEIKEAIDLIFKNRRTEGNYNKWITSKEDAEKMLISWSNGVKSALKLDYAIMKIINYMSCQANETC